LKQVFPEVDNKNRVMVKHDEFGNPVEAAYFARESLCNTLSCAVGWKREEVRVFDESVIDDLNDDVSCG